MKILKKGPSSWSNEHKTCKQNVTGIYTLANETGGTALANYNDTTSGIQKLIADSVRTGMPLKATGGNWSLSTICATSGIVLDTRSLNSRFAIAADSVHPAFTGGTGKLFLFQCGTGIWEINSYLHSRGLSLPASGASNGQTIAGAIATGTHGAGISFGAIQEAVAGLHIITSATESIWLERASMPAATDQFAAKLGARPVRDDATFNAALVSFGAFGFIHGVMIRAEDQYLLECYLRRVPFDDAYRHQITSLDFNYARLPYPGEVPFHFQSLINPYDLDHGAYMTVMYKRPYRTDYTPPKRKGTEAGPGDDAPAFIGALSDAVPATVKLLANKVLSANLKPYEKVFGRLDEIFDNTTLRGKVASAAIGFAPANVNAVIDALLPLNKSAGPFVGVFAFRFVKASQATMAFTRFAPVTCVLELDGVQSAGTTRFYNAVWAELKRLRIPFTFHWGKMNVLDAAMVKEMYGSALTDFLKARNATMDKDTTRAFSNHTLVNWGIDAPAGALPAPPELIV